MDIFISYSHKDHVWKERVTLFLQSMRRLRLLDYSTWDDGEITISDEWQKLILESVDKAKVAILLISPDFLASRFINDVELPRILDRHGRGEVYLVPVIVRPSPWEVVDWLAKIQLHPEGGRALSGGTEFEIENQLKILALEVHRLVTQAKDAPLPRAATSSPLFSAPAERESYQGYPFLTRDQLHELIRVRQGETVTKELLIYNPPSQRVWLLATPGSMYCVIDSQGTAESNRLIQWSQKLTPAMHVDVRDVSRMENAGVVDVGDRQNWLYSKILHPDPQALKGKIQSMLRA